MSVLITFTAAATATPTVPPPMPAEYVAMSSRFVAEIATPRIITVLGVRVRWPTPGSAVPPPSGAETASTLGDLTSPASCKLLLDCSFEFFESMISTADVSV